MRYFLTWIVAMALSAQAQTPEEKPYEYIPDVPDSVIEARLQALNMDIPLVFSSEVKKHIQLYTVTNRDYARKMLNRSSKYFPLFEEYLAKNNMPDELKYLAVVESGLHPNAVSHAAAVGLWQFIYWTGKRYGLESNWYYDDRMDPDKATQAACDFLKSLHDYFGGNWELALAAYNSGPGRVNRAIRYADGQRDYWAIHKYLPRETQAYVPKFVAVTYVFNYAEEHNLFPDEPLYLPVYDTIHVSQYMHLPTFAEHAGLCMEDLEYLNPQIKHAALPATARGYALRIPAGTKGAIVANRQFLMDTAGVVARAEIEKMAANEVGAVAGRDRILYKVRSGDVLGKIASRYNVRVSDIKKWNQMNSDMIRVGQTLKIWVLPKYANQPTGPKVAVTKKPIEPLPGQKVHYVTDGDTLWDISRAHNISIEKIKALNNLTSDNLRPGQALIVGSAN